MSPPSAAPVSRRAAPVFAALGDPTRLALLTRLSGRGAASTTGLAAGAAVTRQAVEKHLRVLAEAGLVRGERRGRERVWELAPARLGEVGAWLAEISRGWDRALARLRAHVEEG